MGFCWSSSQCSLQCPIILPEHHYFSLATSLIRVAKELAILCPMVSDLIYGKQSYHIVKYIFPFQGSWCMSTHFVGAIGSGRSTTMYWNGLHRCQYRTIWFVDPFRKEKNIWFVDTTPYHSEKKRITSTLHPPTNWQAQATLVAQVSFVVSYVAFSIVSCSAGIPFLLPFKWNRKAPRPKFPVIEYAIPYHFFSNPCHMSSQNQFQILL